MKDTERVLTSCNQVKSLGLPPIAQNELNTRRKEGHRAIRQLNVWEPSHYECGDEATTAKWPTHGHSATNNTRSMPTRDKTSPARLFCFHFM